MLPLVFPDVILNNWASGEHIFLNPLDPSYFGNLMWLSKGDRSLGNDYYIHDVLEHFFSWAIGIKVKDI